MKKIHDQRRDFLLPTAATLILTIFLLAGCNLSSPNDETAADLSSASANTETQAVVLEEPLEIQVAASGTSYELGQLQAFSKDKFDQAMADGKPVLLDFHADWCPICRANEPIIKSALESYGDAVGLRINYDTARDLKAKYGVVTQSTYIVIKDGEELARTIGPQSEETVLQLFAS